MIALEVFRDKSSVALDEFSEKIQLKKKKGKKIIALYRKVKFTNF